MWFLTQRSQGILLSLIESLPISQKRKLILMR
ncbi:hypothetical protein [Rhizobium beringeri]